MDKGAEYYSRYLDGDDEGLVLLVRDYKDGLILYINGICKNIHTAEDVCEDTFVRLVTKRPAYNGKASFKTWLYTMARNLAYDELRRRRADVSANGLEIPSDISIEDAYAEDERRAAVRRLVGFLQPMQREAVWLTYFEGLTVKETAKIMKKSENAVSALLNRAKQSLKQMLIKEGITGEDV